MMSARRCGAFARALLLGGLVLGLTGSASAQSDTPAIEGPKVVPFEFDGDLSSLSALPSAAVAKPYRPLLRGPTLRKRLPDGFVAPTAPSVPPGPLAPMPSPIQNFAGVSFSDTCGTAQCGGGWPPDPNGDVGPNHVILGVNTSYALYNKTGTLLSAFQEDALWTSTGSNPCNGNSQGDPIVVYDRLADRWILTHFAFAVDIFGPVSPFYQCIAVSKTGNPVSGGWWLYPLRIDTGVAGQPAAGSLNDYGKFGAWSDCFYMATNQFTGNNYDGVAFASFSRADMYSGAPLTWALGFLPFPAHDVFTLIPSHNMGTGVNAPAPGTPNYFVSESTQTFDFVVRKFTAGPNCGAGGTMGAPVNVSQTPYNYNVGDDVPQPNTSNKLDSLVDRLMQKVVYRKVNGVESVWVTHTVGDGDPNDNNPPLTKTGMQWAQIGVTGGTVATTPVQQGIHWPDALWRFMGSIAVDGQGNMALGYTSSGPNAPDFPSIKYAGRRATDPLNTLPQTEVFLIAGGGSQTNQCGGAPCNRWGDYSSMSVDPLDDCTFWYINEYYDNQTSGTAGNWHTRIGSFKFPTCTAPINGAARTFVSVGGNDANPCNAASPCRTFQHALSLTTPGGEIQVLDSGGYGAVTIDKPVTIAASDGVYAGVSVSSGTGITVNAGASGPVTLRGLTINGIDGSTGIALVSAPALVVENCAISGFGNGISATPAAAGSLTVRNSTLRDNTSSGIAIGAVSNGTMELVVQNATFERNAAGLTVANRGAIGTIRNSVFAGGSNGIIVSPASPNAATLELRRVSVTGNTVNGLVVGGVGGATARVSADNSLFATNGTGIATGAGGTTQVSDSTITRNTTGLTTVGGGTSLSFGNNRLLNNTANGAFTSSAPLQ